jgi:RNA polymerase sigma-70 factor (ECF subfamily)
MTVFRSLLQVTASDAELVLRVRQGDLEAYGDLMRRYRPRFGRYVAHLLGDEDAAEEVLQAAFVRAYQSLDQCRHPERFAAWVFRIIVNQCRTLAIQRGRHHARLAGPDAAERVSVDHPADAEAWRDEIARALTQLVPEQREAFLLKYAEGLSYEEMKDVTGVGTSALKMRVKRACDRLRELLQGVYNG